uniref:Uncharacterized protein n=1 Tax=Arundo donax TaxID=35708 RepID=A0A0A9ERI3_ARUDO
MGIIISYNLFLASFLASILLPQLNLTISYCP